MKNPKPYLFFIFLLVLCTSASAQIINGRFYRFLQGPQAYDYGRFKTELVPPYILSSSADTGSMAFNDNKWYGKKRNGTWVELGSSSFTIGSTFIVTTSSYTIADSVSTVIIDAASDVDVYLPDPEDYDKREITIKNPSENQALFTVPVYYSSTVTSTSLAAGKWIHIKSDAGVWWVTQESGVTSSTSITGGSGGLTGNLD